MLVLTELVDFLEEGRLTPCLSGSRLPRGGFVWPVEEPMDKNIGYLFTWYILQ